MKASRFRTSVKSTQLASSADDELMKSKAFVCLVGLH